MINLLMLFSLGSAAMIGTLHWPHSQCPWKMYGTLNEDNVLMCYNGTKCYPGSDPLGWGCCNCKGGRAQCPRNYPVMCAQKTCGGGTAYCCGQGRFCNGYRPCPSDLAPTVNGERCDIPILEFTPKVDSCICASVTDPHWKTCGGKSFDNHMRGDVLAYKGPDITVNLRQRPCEVNPRYSCNQAFAMGGAVTCGITISGTIGNIVGKAHRDPKLFVTKGGETRTYTGTTAIFNALGEGANQDPRIAACSTFKKNCISHPMFAGSTSIVCIFPPKFLQFRFTDLSGPALRWGLNFNAVLPPGKFGTGTCGTGTVGPLPCGSGDNLFVTETYTGSGQTACQNSTSPPSSEPTCEPSLIASAEEACKVCKGVSPNGEEHFKDCIFDICAGGGLEFGAEIIKQCKEWPGIPGQTTPAPTHEKCDENTERNCIRTGEAETNNPRDCQLACMEDDICVWWSMSGEDCKFCETEGNKVPSPGAVSGNETCDTDGIAPSPTMPPTEPPTEPPSVQPTFPPSRQPTGSPSEHPSVQPTFLPSRQPTGVPTEPPTNDPKCGWIDEEGNPVNTGIVKAEGNAFECQDGSFCDGGDCCSCKGGRYRCPEDYPQMCVGSIPFFEKENYYICANKCFGPMGTLRECDAEGFKPHPFEFESDSEECKCNEGQTIDLIDPDTTTVTTTIPADCEKLCMEDDVCVWWSLTGQDCSMAGDREGTAPAPTPNSESGKAGCGGSTTPVGLPPSSAPTAAPVDSMSPTPAPVDTTSPTTSPVVDTMSPTAAPPTAAPDTMSPTPAPVDTTSPTTSPVEGCNEGQTIDLVNPTTTTVTTTIPHDCEKLCMEDGTCLWWSMTGMDCSMAEEKEDTPPAPAPNSESGSAGCGGSTTPLGTPAPVEDPTPAPVDSVSPTASPVETMPPTMSPTDCKSCRDFDGDKKGCTKDTTKAPLKAIMCDECMWDKKKKVCDVITCASFTQFGMYKCSKNGKKFKDIVTACWWDIKTNTCANTEPTATCAEYGAISKKACKKLGKDYRSCKYEKNSKLCLEKDEKLTCSMFPAKKSKCHDKMKKPAGGCQIVLGQCVEPVEAEPECADDNGTKNKCNSNPLGCFADGDVCKDLPAQRDECKAFNGKPSGCKKNTDNGGLPCIYIIPLKACH